MPSAWRADFKRNDQRIMRYFFTFAKNELGWAGLGPMNTPEGKSNLSRKRVETFALGQGYFIHWPLTPRTPIGDVEQWTGGGRSMVSDQPPAQVGRASYYAALQTRFPAVFMQDGLTAAAYYAAHTLETGTLPTAPVLPINSAPSFDAPVPAPTVAAPAISAPALPVVANQDDLPAALPEPQNGEQEQQQQQQEQEYDPASDFGAAVYNVWNPPEDLTVGPVLADQIRTQLAGWNLSQAMGPADTFAGEHDFALEPEALLSQDYMGPADTPLSSGLDFNLGEPQLSQPAAAWSQDMGLPVDLPVLDGQDLTFAEDPALPLSAPDAAFQGTGLLLDGMTEPQPLELPSSVVGPDYWDQFGLPDLSLGAETGEILDWPAEQYTPPLF